MSDEVVRQEISKLVGQIVSQKQKADALKKQAEDEAFEVQRLTQRAVKLASKTVGEDNFDFLMRELRKLRP